MAGPGTKVRATAVLLVVALVGISAATAVDAAPRSAATTAPAEAEASVQAVDALAGLVTNGPVYDIERVGDMTYLGGDFDYIGERTGPFVGISTATSERSVTFPDLAVAWNSYVSQIEPDGNGGWFVAGSSMWIDNGAVALAHLGADGEIIWTLSSSGGISGIEVHPDVILIAGNFENVNGESRSSFAAVDPLSGTLLPWNPPQLYSGSVGRDVAFADGVVYVGILVPLGGRYLRAFNYPSGTVRPFNPTITSGDVENVEYFDGTIMISGSSTTSGSSYDEFGLPIESLCSLGPDSDRVGNILFTGTNNGLVGCDLTTGEHVFEVTGDHARSSVSAGGGRVYEGFAGGLKAYDQTTGAPVSWSLLNNGELHGSQIVAVSGSNVAAWAQNATSMDVQPRGNLAAIDGDGALTSWAPVADGTVRSLAVDGGGIVVGGEFTKVDGTTRNRLARVDATSGGLDSWDPNANGTVLSVEVASGVTFAGGQFTQVDGESHGRLAAIGGDGHPVSGWGTGASSTVTALDAVAGRLYVGGVFSTVGGVGRSRLAAVDTATGALLAWNPGADDFVRSIAATDEAVYVGGGFQVAGGQPRLRVAALDPSSGVATSWDPGADNEVWAVAVDGETVYVGGTFSQIGGGPRSSLAAVTTTGALTAWDPAPSGSVYSIFAAGGVVSAAGLLGTGPTASVEEVDDTDGQTTASEAVAEAAPTDARSLAFAQYEAPAGVAGKVTEQGSGAAVGGAFVAVLRTTDFSIAAGAVADGSGNFSAAVAPGSYYLYLVDPTGAHPEGFFGAPTTATVAPQAVTAVSPTMASSRGSVTGTVTETGSNTPIGGAWALSLSASVGSTGSTELGVVGNGSGQYTLPGLRAGNHYVALIDPTGAHATRFLPNSPDLPASTPVAVTGGNSTTANGSLPAQTPVGTGAALAGTVTEAGTNTPLAGVNVIALRASDYTMVRGAVTNASGFYSLNLAAGPYKLAFVDSTGLHNMEWHNNQPSTGLATATSVTAPNVANAALDRNTGRMAGTVRDDVTSESLPGVWVLAIGPSGIAGGTITDAGNGSYTIDGLPTGTYRAVFVDPNGGHTLEYHNNSPDYAGATPFNITAANTTTINAALHQP